MTTMNDWNRNIIDEFRANEGKVGGPFQGAPMIIIHHKGRKSGKVYESPLVYQPVDGNFAIFGSKGGYPEHPEWYLNLIANPDLEVEVGTERFTVHARELEGEERERIWKKQKELMPGFADYEKKTTGIREIPVVLLERR
jgi:deazaflavin-dependent oxidoreductase (nitroreductase family)